jgi:hypothetical protein
MRSPDQALMTGAANKLLESAPCVAQQPLSPLQRGVSFQDVSLWKPATAQAHPGSRMSDPWGYACGDVLLVVGITLDHLARDARPDSLEDGQR